jgi:preprotein translocase subunit SecD
VHLRLGMVKSRGTLAVKPAQSLTVEQLHHVLYSEGINRLRIEQQQDNLFVAINGVDFPIKNKTLRSQNGISRIK